FSNTSCAIVSKARRGPASRSVSPIFMSISARPGGRWHCSTTPPQEGTCRPILPPRTRRRAAGRRPRGLGFDWWQVRARRRVAKREENIVQIVRLAIAQHGPFAVVHGPSGGTQHGVGGGRVPLRCRAETRIDIGKPLG